MSEAHSTLTQARLKELLSYDPETGKFTWIAKPNSRANRIKIGGEAGSPKGNGYIQIQVDKKNYLGHRLAYLYVVGEFNHGDLDHVDGNPANNSFKNLRPASRAQNQQNRRNPSSNNACGYLGVSYRKDTDKYTAHIVKNNKRLCIGCFETAEEAYDAYLKAKRELHEFCTI